MNQYDIIQQNENKQWQYKINEQKEIVIRNIYFFDYDYNRVSKDTCINNFAKLCHITLCHMSKVPNCKLTKKENDR